MKFFKKVLSAVLATSMLFTNIAVNSSIVSAAPSISAGWNEALYAEWADSNPDSETVQVGYKLSSATDYTYLSGDDLTYLVRPSSTKGYGRVDIPGLTPGRYDITITASDGTVHTRNGIKVYEYDRSGYAHWNYSEGVGGYDNDGTPKDNAIIIYVTDENKDTVTIPGYENTVYNYTSSSSGATWTRTCEGIGNILNNNMKFIDEVTKTHPLIVRFIGEISVPKNLTPYNTKDTALGGSSGDNGNMAITKYGRNITLEGIGADTTINGWGFSFSQTSTCPKDAGKSFEVRNLTFKNYPEDALGFQGDDAIDTPIERVWVHNNTFYPGYCANPTESDKAEGDGSCDFKRGQYYTMSYNHYVNCHKTNLLGAGDSNDQFFMSLHHNWYEGVATRQPLGAGGNVHIYNTYFQNASSTTIDLRGKAAGFSEANYFENCKNAYKLRKSTSNLKTYNDYLGGSTTIGDVKGTLTQATTRTQSGIPDNGLAMPDGGSIKDWDTNPKYFYCDAAGNTSVSVLNDVMDVPEYVTTYAGTLKAFPETESGEIVINVTSGGTAINDAVVTANGLTFKNNGNGTYTATASLGAEYVITVSKEGYSNVIITAPVLNSDGEMFTANANLEVDYDGYAVVKLVGGSANAAVKGATVTLTDGTVLVDQNDGTYKSEKQIAVGSYSVNISNTGDYVAPTSAVAIAVKTTDEATEVHLEKVKGAVSVVLQANADATKELDASTAKVYVGTTQLTYAGNNEFTGEIDINVASDVTVGITGWTVESITPAQLTATKSGTVSATATLKEGGKLYTWNYTEGTNTEEFFVFAAEPSSWSSAKNNPMTFDGESLTAAIKVQSSTNITFNAPADGELTLVIEDAGKTGSTVELNGVDYPVTTGTVVLPAVAGTNTLKKGKNETHLYLLQYVATGDAVITPDVSESTTEGTTAATTVTTTEATTEDATKSTPVEYGDAVTNSDTGISVTYDAATDTWSLVDTSTDLAAELNIPFATPITSGKVVITGKATPSSNNSKWAFVKVMGMLPDATTGEGVENEVASLTSDSNKNVTLRTDSTTYAASTTALAAQTYDYKFIIDMDAKTVSLTVGGKEYTGTTSATSLTGIGSITSVSGERNVSLTTPYVGIIQEGPATLSDEIMWDVTVDLAEGNGLTMGEAFLNNMEESGPVAFVDGDNTYELENWVQPKNNPLAADGYNPANSDGIPVSGGYIKFTAPADGAFTMAVKTNGGKITYVNDETGANIKKIDNTDLGTTYDIVRFNVSAGKSYYIFAGGSKTCLYYLGYTSGKTVPEDPTTESTTESTTEATTESTTEATTESTTESTTEATTESTTTEPLPPAPAPVYGDADGDGDVDANDVAVVIQHILNGAQLGNDAQYADVNSDSKIDSRDAAMILQNVLDSSYTLPRA